MRRIAIVVTLAAAIAAAGLAPAHEDHGAAVSTAARGAGHDEPGGAAAAVTAEARDRSNHAPAGLGERPSRPTPAADRSPEAPRPDDEGRPPNHGSYVSLAATCEDVVVAGVTVFTAPTACEGRAKGEYVSSVARSDLGKPEAARGPAASRPAEAITAPGLPEQAQAAERGRRPPRRP